MKIDELINAIQMSLTPDLLKKKYRVTNKNNPMFGHCYVATETLYHLLKKYNTDDYSNYKPCRGRDNKESVHWWLQDDQGNILDPTESQYISKGLKPPYEKGRRGGFLTSKPSNRSKIVIKRVQKLVTKGRQQIYKFPPN